MRRVLGGSWTIENVIMSLMAMIMAITLANSFNISELKSDHKHLNRKFSSLASDFKEHKNEATENFHKIDGRFDRIEHRLANIEAKL